MTLNASRAPLLSQSQLEELFEAPQLIDNLRRLCRLSGVAIHCAFQEQVLLQVGEVISDTSLRSRPSIVTVRPLSSPFKAPWDYPVMSLLTP